MPSSLLAGVSGLRAHQLLLDVVGNNLANINTIGFKSQRVHFADLMSDTIRGASGPVSGQLGGTNPLQVGLGVKVAAIDTELREGSLEATGKDLDLAIQGEGYFVVNDRVRNLFTRAGAFGVDESNTLVDPATGFLVQRFGVVGEGDSTTPAFQIPGDSSIHIPYGASIPGQQTSIINFGGNLDALAVGPLQEVLTSRQPLQIGGVPATAATLLNSIDDNVIAYVAGDMLQITGTNVDGTVVSSSLAVDGTTTVGDLIAAINSLYTNAAAAIDATGNLVLQANNTGPADLALAVADDPGNTGSTNFANLAMLVTVDGKDGDTLASTIQIYDTQGTPHNLSLTFQKQGSNLWDLTAAIDPSQGTMIDDRVEGLQFNDDGSFQQVTGTGVGDRLVSFQINGLSSPQTLDFFFGSPSGFDGLTQYGGSSSAQATEQDGYTAGYLAGVSVGTDGLVEGVFTNSRTLPIAQIAIAIFTNPGGLERLGDNYFGLSTNSGLPLIGTGLSGGRGSVQNGTLESSNVDVALEFTRMITAQRGFQVNARTITATDEVLQELANIIR